MLNYLILILRIKKIYETRIIPTAVNIHQQTKYCKYNYLTINNYRYRQDIREDMYVLHFTDKF